jgi:hypothetical protein
MDRDPALDLEAARKRSDEGAHAGLTDPPVFDGRRPAALVLHDPRPPDIEHARAHSGFGITTERTTAGSDELRAVVERIVTLPARCEPASQAARALEHGDLRVGTRQFVRAGEACDACADHCDAYVCDPHEFFVLCAARFAGW